MPFQLDLGNKPATHRIGNFQPTVSITNVQLFRHWFVMYIICIARELERFHQSECIRFENFASAVSSAGDEELIEFGNISQTLRFLKSLQAFGRTAFR